MVCSCASTRGRRQRIPTPQTSTGFWSLAEAPDRARRYGLENRVAELRAAHPGAPLVTFSHFVPRLELVPEKRFLFLPSLNKAVGSA